MEKNFTNEARKKHEKYKFIQSEGISINFMNVVAIKLLVLCKNKVYKIKIAALRNVCSDSFSSDSYEIWNAF